MCRVWGQGSSRDGTKKITGYMHRMGEFMERRQNLKIHCTHNMFSVMLTK